MEEQQYSETHNESVEVDELTEEGRARLRKEQAEMRAHRKPARGLVIINTGNGKGKTTAALGVLFRAWGQNMRVVMLQFLKSQTGKWGEIRAAQKMGVEIIPLGEGFTWNSDNLEHDKALARQCWQLCREKIESNQYDIVIMDEITYAINYGWLDVNEVLSTLQARNPKMHVIITGRDAPQALIDYADLVTEMTEIKHPYHEGILAQKGIDF
ncbi:cob(I)alamin adenosyltransferase [Dictyobacter sp. S3.2.2.5]|uniref:Cob(I)alamin adenosyltransferase n=1 Tax=Dictyobacter halimunensis TaxID=3026934 RepID=A0ABQ6FST5_9CHLR|nr:cob(I)alamin adenosyltransferase [Dictyobacter sp. S3.2.2.5]